MSLNVQDELFEKLLLYKIVKETKVIAISTYDKDTKTLHYIGETMESLKELLSFLKQFKIEKVHLINETIALDLMKDPAFKLDYSDMKFYKNIKGNKLLDLITIKEINKENSYLLWDNISEYIDQGISYFGGFLNGEIKCCAGISRVSKLRSEIIAVHTFKNDDRNKGYASILCNYLIDLALEKVDIATWTTGYSNIASINTAKNIGMKHFISIFTFEYNNI